MRHSCAPFCLLIFYLVAAISCCAQDREDDIVANLAGGQVIVHVAKDAIVFAAIDHPVERNSIPPRVLALDSTPTRRIKRRYAWNPGPARAGEWNSARRDDRWRQKRWRLSRREQSLGRRQDWRQFRPRGPARSTNWQLP